MTTQACKFDIDYLPRLKARDEVMKRQSEETRTAIAFIIGVIGFVVMANLIIASAYWGVLPDSPETIKETRFYGLLALGVGYATSMIISFGVFTKDMRKRALQYIKSKF